LHLDDGVVAVVGEEAAKPASQPASREDLVKAGLVEHSAKCIWEPTLKLKWLGFDIDLVTGQISVPGDKLCSLKAQLQVEHPNPLTSITGKILSISTAMGTVTHLMTRSMYALLNTQKNLIITNSVKMKFPFGSSS